MNIHDKLENSFPAETLEKIFDVCLRMLLKRGLAEASVRDIAKQAGVDEDLLLESFPTERDVLITAMQWSYMKYGRQIQAAMALHSDFVMAMNAVLIDFMELCYDQNQADQGLFAPTLMDLGYIDEHLWLEAKRLQLDWENHVRDKLIQCQADLKDPDEIEALTCYIMISLEGLYKLVKYGAPVERLYKAIDLIVEALRSYMKEHPIIPE